MGGTSDELQLNKAGLIRSILIGIKPIDRSSLLQGKILLADNHHHSMMEQLVTVIAVTAQD